MDDVAGTPPLADPRTITALGERVAVVETKVGSLKEDTTVIRTSMHGINNEVMKITVLEQRCFDTLTTITTQVDKLTTSVADLLSTRNQMEGAWSATVRISASIVASLSILGVLAKLLGLIK